MWKKMKIPLILRVLSLSLFVPTAAQALCVHCIDGWIDRTLPGAHVGVLVQQVGESEPLYHRNAEHYFYPASLTKLFSSWYAWKELGPQWRYSTMIVAPDTALVDGTLTQDAVFIASGAPDFTLENLEDLIDGLSDAGVRRIEGDIILDTSSMIGSAMPNFMLEDRPWYFAAPSGALVLNRNSFYAKIDSKNIGERATFIPVDKEGYLPNIQSNILSLPEAQANKECPLEADYNDTTELVLGGCWPAERHEKRLKFAIADPAAYFSYEIERLLIKEHITLTGKVRLGETPYADGLTVLSEIRSKTIEGLMEPVMFLSDNITADNLFRTMAGVHTRKSGSLALGRTVMGKMLADESLPALKQSTIYDGSGASRYNTVTPNALATLLSLYEAEPDLISTMPLYGRSTPVASYSIRSGWDFRVKTGSATGVSGLAGFLEGPRGQRFHVVFLVNNAPYRYGKLKSFEENLLEQIVAAVE